VSVRIHLLQKYINVQFHRRRSREVVHLSYKRLDVKKSEKLWDIGKIMPSIRELVVVFLDVADPKIIHPRMYQLKNLLNEHAA